MGARTVSGKLRWEREREARKSPRNVMLMTAQQRADYFAMMAEQDKARRDTQRKAFLEEQAKSGKYGTDVSGGKRWKNGRKPKKARTATAKKREDKRRHGRHIGLMCDRLVALKSMGFGSYEEYLQGDLWKGIRQNVLERDNGVCRVCESFQATQVHHTNYGRDVLRGENTHKLIAICRHCHEFIEFLPNGQKAVLDQVSERLTARRESLGLSPM